MFRLLLALLFVFSLSHFAIASVEDESDSLSSIIDLTHQKDPLIVDFPGLEEYAGIFSRLHIFPPSGTVEILDKQGNLLGSLNYKDNTANGKRYVDTVHRIEDYIGITYLEPRNPGDLHDLTLVNTSNYGIITIVYIHN